MGYIGADPALNESVTSAQIADDAITLAKMASGTDGAMLTYDADGNPVAITGTDGQVATSAGANAVSAFEAAAGGDVSKVGTPENNEVGIWTGDGTIEGDSNITYDGTTFTVNDAFAMGSGMQFTEVGRGTLSSVATHPTFGTISGLSPAIGSSNDGIWLVLMTCPTSNTPADTSGAVIWYFSMDEGARRTTHKHSNSAGGQWSGDDLQVYHAMTGNHNINYVVYRLHS